MNFMPRLAQGRLAQLLKTQKIVIILGSRQVGKTTLVQQVFRTRNVYFLNLDIEVDKQRFLAASKITPKAAIKSFGMPEVLVIDEAQGLIETGKIVKGWYDSAISTKIVLLGSSSLNILNQSTESLTGRNVKLFLTPLLFKEIISTQDWYSTAFSWNKIQRQFSEQVRTLLLETLVFGSYPEAVTTAQKPQYLTNLVSDFLLKDILNLGLVKDPGVIKRLLMLLAFQTGSEVSINELANNLNLSRVTVDRYIDLLEQTFVIFRLPAFSTNLRKEIAKNSKIYFWDTGIRNALLGELSVNPLRSDIGKLWENWVVSELAKENIQLELGKTLYFWRSRAGSEVDLIVKDGEKISAFEIKWLSHKKRGSKAFKDKYGVDVKIITSNFPIVSLAEKND
ncbi:ATPase [Candidatus Roizmanbacteria bacterium CG22_combo_CG10-13_8_21_14_all_38_20]|uniref:ATPase n=1 Tax=Candidatus Roizmanbacteria bacterium CG22_combo_CG10-13_8_21_14_all_38_20 TaxID=1974862 RepID=A0A2H0BU89_9BACT|nr:ATP-binding protein [Candidatus Microgenomates bacterium]PIP61255.1 MAG: ATPase [Candidatus Roizmanbacteria bacterium CG22_combo_CG10-13_8_21_14_all_38_20]PJC31731.1 MAG: ATPase [Candidatus Roizmanbacteria bacterium CG_4_9_14_0_2_um_filter_38_17]